MTDEKNILESLKRVYSGGQRGVQIKIATQDLIKATEAEVVDLELEKN